MRYLLAALMILAVSFIAALIGGISAEDAIAQNATEHSRVFVIGYMDESRIIQTQKGFSGHKLVAGTRGSGIASRTIDAEVYSDSNMEEASYTVSAQYDYKPYTAPLTQSDLKNALCAKNYEVGSVYSESYTNLKDLIKDTNIYQDDNMSVYDIDSEVQGVARIGSKVQKNANTVPSYFMSGTYIGYSDIRTEIRAGNMSVLTLPCP